MSAKHKGGKGKRADYQTQVLRIPVMLVQAVQGMVEQYHQQRTNAVTGISIEDVFRLAQLTDEDSALLTSCWLGRRDEEYVEPEGWQETLAEYLLLSDEVNQAIWSMDNTWAGVGYRYDISLAVEQLVRFGLIAAPTEVRPASALEVARFITANSYGLKSPDDVAVEALTRGDYSVFAAMYQPIQQDRATYWHEYYTSQLGATGTDYWSWKANPESRDVCGELTMLLDILPEPSALAKRLLAHLADETPPFFRVKPVLHSDGYYHCSMPGALASDEQALQILNDFMDWVSIGERRLTSEVFSTLLIKLFICNSYSLQELNNLYTWACTRGSMDGYYDRAASLAECWAVLQVLPNSSKTEIKTAYREMSKKLHPDVNRSPDAAEQFRQVRQAYEQAMAG